MIIRAFAALGLIAASAGADFRPDARTHHEVIAAVRAYEAFPPSRDAKIVAELTRDRNTNPPPYLFELTRRLLTTNEPEALYMISLANVRATYDSRRCLRDVRRGVDTLHEALPVHSDVIGPRVMRALAADDMLSVSEEAMARDELFRSEASPWWICSYGLSATEAAGLAPYPERWLKPKSEWRAIEEQMRKAIIASMERKRTASP
jgi:hypothetical protein